MKFIVEKYPPTVSHSGLICPVCRSEYCEIDESGEEADGHLKTTFPFCLSHISYDVKTVREIKAYYDCLDNHDFVPVTDDSAGSCSEKLRLHGTIRNVQKCRTCGFMTFVANGEAFQCK